MLSAAQYNNLNNSHNPLQDPANPLSPIRASPGNLTNTPFLPANSLNNNNNSYAVPMEPHSPMRHTGIIPTFPGDEGAFNPSESYPPGGFNAVEHYNQVLMQQVQVGIRELQRLAIRSRAESDFTGAQALDAVSVELVAALSRVDKGLSSGVFSLLDSESGTPATDGGIEINELIAREGTSFLTSDYIFQFTSGREGHSIGSLAIVAGAGAVLRFIRAEWPGLTALSAPQYGQPQLPSHGEESQWGSASIIGCF